MLFASIELAARIERSETGMLASSFAELRRRRPDDDAFCIPLAGGLARYAGPGSPMNKVAGVGFAGPLDEAAFAEVEAQYTTRGVPVQVELATLADPSIGRMLTRRGYELVNCENVLGLEIADLPGEPAGGEAIRVEVCGREDLAAWIDLLVTGFESPDTAGVPSHEHFARADLERALGDTAATGRFMTYLARREGQPAGGGGLYIGDGVAHFCGAATLPAHRRRGVQTALLEYRLRDAARRGCSLAVVTTQPGSKSQQNAQRRGFELLYSRNVLVR